MANNGYLEKDRLANVIAAIQIMAVSGAPSGTLARWIGELDAAEEPAEGERNRPAIHYADRKKWSGVFEEHPEFFKSYTVKGVPHVALRLRLALAGSADAADEGDAGAAAVAPVVPSQNPDAPERLFATEIRTEAAGKPSGDAPLSIEQIDLLINTAIKLHGMAASDARTPERSGSRWMFSAAGAIVGSILGGSLVAFLVWNPAIVHHIFD